MLLDHHLADLRRSGLTDETIRDAGLDSESDPRQISKLLRWDWPGAVNLAATLGSCLVLPYRHLQDGTMNGYARLRPDHPRPDKGKYEAPLGVGNRAYFPVATIDAIKDSAGPIGITEGEKKALASCQAGLPCIAIAGVWPWQKKRQKDEKGKAKGERELIDDLAEIDWYGWQVWICFDTDPRRNPSVSQAKAELMKILSDHGARVVDVVLPVGRAVEVAGVW